MAFIKDILIWIPDVIVSPILDKLTYVRCKYINGSPLNSMHTTAQKSPVVELVEWLNDYVVLVSKDSIPIKVSVPQRPDYVWRGSQSEKNAISALLNILKKEM